MRRALSYARTFGPIVSQHAEDLSLTSCGCMAEGEVSARLGLPGTQGLARLIASDGFTMPADAIGADHRVPRAGHQPLDRGQVARVGSAKGKAFGMSSLSGRE